MAYRIAKQLDGSRTRGAIVDDAVAWIRSGEVTLVAKPGAPAEAAGERQRLDTIVRATLDELAAAGVLTG